MNTTYELLRIVRGSDYISFQNTEYIVESLEKLEKLRNNISESNSYNFLNIEVIINLQNKYQTEYNRRVKLTKKYESQIYKQLSYAEFTIRNRNFFCAIYFLEEACNI